MRKDGLCCIGKPSPIELKLTVLDFVGPIHSEKSRGARKIDTFGKKESPQCEDGKINAVYFFQHHDFFF